ncbi:hypothetical protein THAOC_33824, partial [Thalassiosira oceanica]
DAIALDFKDTCHLVIDCEDEMEAKGQDSNSATIDSSDISDDPLKENIADAPLDPVDQPEPEDDVDPIDQLEDDVDSQEDSSVVEVAPFRDDNSDMVHREEEIDFSLKENVYGGDPFDPIPKPASAIHLNRSQIILLLAMIAMIVIAVSGLAMSFWSGPSAQIDYNGKEDPAADIDEIGNIAFDNPRDSGKHHGRQRPPQLPPKHPVYWAMDPLMAYTLAPMHLSAFDPRDCLLGAHKELNKLGPRSGRSQRAQQAWAPLGAHTKSSTNLAQQAWAPLGRSNIAQQAWAPLGRSNIAQQAWAPLGRSNIAQQAGPGSVAAQTSWASLPGEQTLASKLKSRQDQTAFASKTNQTASEQ